MRSSLAFCFLIPIVGTSAFFLGTDAKAEGVQLKFCSEILQSDSVITKSVPLDLNDFSSPAKDLRSSTEQDPHEKLGSAGARRHLDLQKSDKGSAPSYRDFSNSAKFQPRSFLSPRNEAELVQIVKNASGPISVLGGGYSMGGQVADRNGVTIDMSLYNQILNLDVAGKTLTVQAGATWNQIQRVIYKKGLAIQVMQSYSNFQVGGSLSVNVHGRYVGYGPIISSVQSIKVLLANGQVLRASRTENSDLFFGAIGGYGGLGIILEATLSLADNVKIERRWKEFFKPKGTLAQSAADYVQFFRESVLNDSTAVMTNADIYPPDYNRIRSITYYESQKPLTVLEHLQDPDKPLAKGWQSYASSFLNSIEQLFTIVKRYRETVYEPKQLAKEKVVTRNWEASATVDELTPLNQRIAGLKKMFGFANRKSLLQEYFIPAEQLPVFLEKMKEVFQSHDVNVTNVSIRHVPKNTESLLSWSTKESFALVIYYTQPYGKDIKTELEKAQKWTQQMLDQVLAVGGSYYLPYQLYARTDQFRQAYPGFGKYQAAKNKYDPKGKFSNYFLDTYVLSRESFNFKSMLESESAQIDMMDFFKNVFGIIDPHQHLAAIREVYRQLKSEGIETNDRNMYSRLQSVLPTYAGNPVAKAARSAVSLRTQQQEMANQAAGMLSHIGRTSFNGYVEIGTPGRYVGYLKGHPNLSLKGPTFVVNESQPKLLSPPDLLERTGGYGALDPRSYTSAVVRSKYVDLSDYDTISQTDIPNTSVDLVSVFIGLHHSPPHKLRAFVASINRILRNGGLLILRDHDVNSFEMNRMANLAHSTFNAGLGVSFEAETREIRNFHSIDYWIQFLKDSGFELATDQRILQKGDPSINTLVVFKKVRGIPNGDFEEALANNTYESLESLKSISGYFRSGTHTYMVGPEWFWVDVYQEYAAFQARLPWYLFPFDKYLELAKKVYSAQAEYARRQGIDDTRAFNEYDSMDKFLLTANGVQFWLLQKAANLTKWMLRKESPPQNTGFVVQGLTDAQINQFSEGVIQQYRQLSEDVKFLSTQRQMPFTKAMIEMAAHEDVKLLEVAGNTDIGVLFVSSSAVLPDNVRSLKSVDEVYSYQYPTEISSKGSNKYFHSVKVHVSELGSLIRIIQRNSDEVMRVHDY